MPMLDKPYKYSLEEWCQQRFPDYQEKCMIVEKGEDAYDEQMVKKAQNGKKYQEDKYREHLRAACYDGSLIRSLHGGEITPTIARQRFTEAGMRTPELIETYIAIQKDHEDRLSELQNIVDACREGARMYKNEIGKESGNTFF